MHSKLHFDELTAKVAASSGLSKRQAALLLRELGGVVAMGLARDGHVRLAHFGSFDVRTIAPHTGRHPATGERLEVEASRRVVFHPASALKQRLNAERPGTQPAFDPRHWLLVTPALLLAFVLPFAKPAQRPALALVPTVTPVPVPHDRAAPLPTDEPREALTPPAPRHHIVARGDTLTSLAARYLSSADAWPRIVRVNAALRDPDRIYVGQTLVIPDR